MLMLSNFAAVDNYNFSGGNITSDSGALLFARFFDSLDILHAFRSLPFDDRRKNPIHSYPEILLAQIFKFLLGYFRQADQSVFQLDPFLASTAPSQSTLSRFFSCASASLNASLHQLLQSLAFSYLNSRDHDLIFDADSTLIETTGHQEGSAYIPHYSSVGYHPILINEYHSKLLVASLLRCGNSYSANGIIEQLHSVFSCLDPRSSKTVFFRGDSAFYNSELMDYLEQQPFHVRYMIRCRHFGKLVQECMDDMDSKGIDFQNYSKKDPYIGDFFYSLTNSEPRRVVYKAYRSIDKNGQISLFPEIYGVMTNCIEWSARNILRFYEQRGNSENFTKELKDDFGAGRLSHPSFLSNEFEFLIKAWAYNIYHFFLNKKAKEMPSILRMRMNTFRREFIKIGGKVIRHAKRTVLCMSSAYPRKEEFMKLMHNIQKE